MTRNVSRSDGSSGRARRFVVALCVVALGLAACGNSGDDDDGGATGTTSGDDSASSDDAASGDRDTFVEISGVPGVTDDDWLAGARAHFPGEIVVGRDLMEI